MLLKDGLLWIYWRPFRALVQVLPIGLLYPLGRIIGRVVAVISRHRRCELTNVMARTPALALLPNRQHWVARAFQEKMFSEMEMLVYPKMTAGNIDRFVRWREKECLDHGLAQGRGVMLIFAHLGANQMIMPAVGYSGYPMCQMSASPLVWKTHLKHKRFSRMEERALFLRWQHELSLPVRHIDVFGSLKAAFSCLARNEVLGIAMDGAGGTDWVEVDFLGTKARFSTGAMRIAARTQCVVIPVFMIRDDTGVNEMILAPSLDSLSRGSENEKMKNLLQQLVHRLEEYVVAHPSLYLHFLALRQLTAEKEGEPAFLQDSSSNKSRGDHE